MEQTLAFLRDRPYYEGQLCDHRVLPGREATMADLDIAPRLASALEARGIDDLYGHQARAIEAIRGGDDVVLATPTASGKSLAYTVPAFERAMDGRWGGGTPDDAASDGRGTTLYIAPQVALINDQADTLSSLAQDLGFGTKVRVEQYTGRLSKSEKRDARERQPTVLLTTPDMLHYGILPHAHRLWDWFFESLETVVVDEVHEYRGVFGSQVSLLFRRLNRVAQRFESDPQYVCCSATIGNPVDHAATVTGQHEANFTLVDTDESATGPTHWLVWNPPKQEGGGGMGRRRSNHVETKQLFVDLVMRGLQTLVFTASRQTAERYAKDSTAALRERGEHDAADSVTAYQAALTDERRREIEDGLHDGSIRGVWSTNALELGVDVGGLDAVILDGYPGTRMAAFQQGGRAGRGIDPALVVLVTGEDQLDQYVAANPEVLFEQDPEKALSNPENQHLLPAHVRAAARENWLSPEDDEHFGSTLPDIVARLEQSGDLERRDTNKGIRWTYDGGGSPQHDMGLRTIDDREVKLRDEHSGEVIAKLGFDDALRDAHPGAVYHHQGRTYEVTELDLRHDVATLERTRADYFTRVRHDKEITVEADHTKREISADIDVPVHFADVTMRKQITGFERRNARSGEVIAREGLDLPETTLETSALYYTLPLDLSAELDEAGDFAGGIHAAEHAMISLFPLSFLCDRRDIGGLSTPMHPHTARPTIFIYDGYPGGVGLTRAAFDSFEQLTERTYEMLTSCDCADGCPACVQSPHCGNANDPLDKAVAIQLLDALRDPHVQ